MTNTNFAVFGWFSSFASDQNTGEGEGLLIRGGLAVGEWIFNAQFFSALVFFFCTQRKKANSASSGGDLHGALSLAESG